MSKIKVGDTCLFDENNELNTREYQPARVKVLKKKFGGKYIVLPIEPLVYPTPSGSYASKPFETDKKYLTVIPEDEHCIIRTTLDVPIFQKGEVVEFKAQIDRLKAMGVADKKMMDTFMLIYTKADYASNFIRSYN